MDQNNFLNLPHTSFPMKANLVINELKILKKWIDLNLYKKLHFKNRFNQSFIIHDGPPYANGNIHLGHALNKILKDIILKYKSFNNFNITFIPGWDCHGLPIELKVNYMTNMTNIYKINRLQFIDKCEQYAKSQVITQKKDFIRLGILADWKNNYLTMNYNIQANTIKILAKIIKLNYLYRDYKPVYWCIKCTSSLAEAEVEYKIKKSLTAYILFFIYLKSINNKKILSILNYNTYLVIWTTTIWTLPTNKAIAINPNFYYLIVQCNNKFNIIIEKTIFLIKKKYLLQNINYKILGQIKGKNLFNIQYYSLFNKIKLPVIFDESINNLEGTGIVHIAPDHGINDYELAKKYKINTINLINKYGNYKYDDNLPNFIKGKNIFTINEIIIKFLKKKKYILNTIFINHKYPYCWRHKYPIIFRSTPQWFINMNMNNLRYKCINNIKKIIWLPEWGKQRMIEMINIRPDWCISRQRLWGVPLPLFIHRINNNIHPNMDVILLRIINKIKKYGVKFWWKLKKNKYLNSKEINIYDKVVDIIDIWFDSGSSFYTVLKNKFINLFLEGNDQYRGWFMSTIILSTIINNKPPCKLIISHGFVVDENGKKMSKSLSNNFSPKKIINKYGADILRLWVVNNNFTHEISLSNKQLDNITIIYRKIRNTIKYLLSNLYDFNNHKQYIILSKLLFIDKWIINECIILNNKISFLYKKYKFHKILKMITIFCSITLGTYYLDIIKDRLYTMPINSIGRKSSQITLWHILLFILHWIAPILSFTAEETWDYLLTNKNFNIINKSIFLTNWYNLSLKCLNINSTYYNNWLIIIKIKKAFNKILEFFKKEKKINSTLQIKVLIFLPLKIINKIKLLTRELSFLLLTNKVSIIDNKYLYHYYPNKYYYIHKNISFILKYIKFPKCSRCWHYKLSVNNNNKFSLSLCTRCIINLNNINSFNKGEKRFYF